MSYYKERNWGNIAKLADNTKKAATTLLNWAESEGIEVLIYETIRTKEQQAENVKKGASQTIKSYHLTGQALDFVPAKGSTVQWDGYGRAEIKNFVAKAKSLGFEWGGDWKSFIDKPHLQFNYKGYGSDTFNGKGTSTNAGTTSMPKPVTNSGALGLVDYLKSKKNRFKLC
ncbi:L-alanoyl-D-glutamate peptidase [Listeria fleischmannii FSL S10-1203]|uniref:L-alanoyl-D-glutamate peptidase n=1 Tax=Listeria fleischmannii FSL S10-1203 TaxID=1265822 RepID=W7DQF7_9LIST|nr:L-alanoyl-D-glutamate peptidase [Listeria fleischmannii FSL S10-1203]